MISIDAGLTSSWLSASVQVLTPSTSTVAGVCVFVIPYVVPSVVVGVYPSTSSSTTV